MAPIGCQLRRSLSVPLSSLTTCERGAVILEGLGVNMASPRVLTGAAYGGAKIDVASAAGMHCQVGMFAMLSRSVASRNLTQRINVALSLTYSVRISFRKYLLIF